jgi:chaperonin GroES
MSEKNLSKIRPLSDHIVVEPIDETTTTTSGLIIPDTVSKERPQRGKVLYVGPGKTDNNGKIVPVEVKAGDTVLFTKYGPTEVELEGRDLLILVQSDILAVLE